MQRACARPWTSRSPTCSRGRPCCASPSRTPRRTAPTRWTVNDCNDDGDVADAGIDDNDCNNNGPRDVVVKATSLGESVDTLVDIGQPPGELVYLDRVSVGVYVGELVISAIYDTAGVLFVNQEGTDAPAVTLTYEDNDDGTGIKCQNDVDPAARGRVQVATTILFDTGEVAVINGIVTDNIAPSDADGFADSGETVDLALTVRNGTTTDLTGLVARLTTNDSKIDCIIDPFISIGSLNAGSVNVTTEKFRFKVANGANRTSVTQDFSALFLITMTSDQFDALVTPAGLTLDLDLNAVGGSGPTTFIEGFEGSLGTFGINNVDFGRHSEAASEGYRCQYNDPDWINANSYGEHRLLPGQQPHAGRQHLVDDRGTGFRRRWSWLPRLELRVLGCQPRCRCVLDAAGRAGGDPEHQPDQPRLPRSARYPS